MNSLRTFLSLASDRGKSFSFHSAEDLPVLHRMAVTHRKPRQVLNHDRLLAVGSINLNRRIDFASVLRLLFHLAQRKGVLCP
jgi:hypothetical protein